MIKTTYLHVGNFKTGTSAIQKFCNEHREQLLEHGLDYLKQARPASNPTNHSKLPLSLVTKYQEFLPDWYEEKDSFDSVASGVREAMVTSHCDKILISSEEFYRFASFRKNSIAALTTDLRTILEGQNVKIIMYVRRPIDFLKSWYNEVSKARTPQKRFIDFFYFLDEAFISPRKNAEFWRNCFGPDCLILEPYSLYGFEHIDRFLKLLNIDLNYDKPEEQVLVNPKRDEFSLEQDRISKIIASCSKPEREQYLRSFVFKSDLNVKLLRKKIQLINDDFQRFCREEKLSFQDASFNLRDLLVHEEYINRKDVILPSPIQTLKSRILNPNIIRRLKRVKNSIG